MNQKIVKQLNHLQVEKAELKSALKNAELNEEYADEKDDIKKDLASVEQQIKDLGEHLLDPEEDETDTTEENTES